MKLLSQRRSDQISPIGAVLRVLVLLAWGVFFGLPLLWIVLAPTKNDAQLIDLSPAGDRVVRTYWPSLAEPAAVQRW